MIILDETYTGQDLIKNKGLPIDDFYKILQNEQQQMFHLKI